jgi:DNA repair protein SbcC/Rad50
LWARFKAATDAVFTQREAAFAARDAELAANLTAAHALVDRLAALDIDMPAAEIQRTLAEVDRAWRQGGEVPRAAIAALEARFDAARSAAAELLNAGQQRRWQARCDALAARLALCEAREDGAEDAGALQARWAAPETALAVLPAPWQQALAQRWAQAPGAGPLAAAQVDDLLLRLEAALDLPTAPAWQAARQQLKLRALKDTMEGRAPAQAGPQQNAGWLQALLRQAGLDAAQRARLQALVAALRAAQPAVLGLPAEKA